MTFTLFSRRRVGALLDLVSDAIARRASNARAQDILRECAAAGTGIRLRMPVVVYAPERLTLGDNVDIGEFVVLRAGGGLRIGDRVLVAAHAVITTAGHREGIPRWDMNETAPIVIEDDVWIGANATVLPGVTVGRGAIVAAGAVVTHSVEPLTVVAGVPARPLRSVASDPG